MARGRRPKRIRSTTGLRNNSSVLTATPPRELSPDGWSEAASVGVYFDSTRLIIDEDDAGCESDLDVDDIFECEDWEDEGLRDNMYLLAVREGDDPSDEDWLPPGLHTKKKLKTSGEHIILF